MIGPAIRAILLAHPDVSSLVGDRVYPEMAPQGSDMPAVTYRIRREPTSHQQGLQGFDRFDLEIDCWSRGRPGVAAYDEAQAVADAVVGALSGYRGISQGVELHSVIAESSYDDGFDDETGLHQVGVDVSIWAQRAP